MEYNKEILVKDYFDIHDHYAMIYGINRTIIVIQVLKKFEILFISAICFLKTDVTEKDEVMNIIKQIC